MAVRATGSSSACSSVPVSRTRASALWLGAGIAVSLLALRRDTLRTNGPWLAAVIAVALFVPNLVWQAQHDWPTVEFARNALADKYKPVSRPGFLKEAALLAGPAGAALFITALAAPFFSAAARHQCWIALALGTVLAILLAQRSAKSEYLGAAFPTAFAAGAAVVDRWAGTRRRAFGVAIPGAIVAAGYATVVAPFAVPLLSIERFVRYEAALGIAPQTSENKELGRLPQGYADTDRLAAQARSHGRASAAELTPEERGRSIIFADDRRLWSCVQPSIHSFEASPTRRWSSAATIGGYGVPGTAARRTRSSWAGKREGGHKSWVDGFTHLTLSKRSTARSSAAVFRASLQMRRER